MKLFPCFATGKRNNHKSSQALPKDSSANHLSWLHAASFALSFVICLLSVSTMVSRMFSRDFEYVPAGDAILSIYSNSYDTFPSLPATLLLSTLCTNM